MKRGKFCHRPTQSLIRKENVPLIHSKNFAVQRWISGTFSFRINDCVGRRQNFPLFMVICNYYVDIETVGVPDFLHICYTAIDSDNQPRFTFATFIYSFSVESKSFVMTVRNVK